MSVMYGGGYPIPRAKWLMLKTVVVERVENSKQ